MMMMLQSFRTNASRISLIKPFRCSYTCNDAQSRTVLKIVNYSQRKSNTGTSSTSTAIPYYTWIGLGGFATSLGIIYFSCLDVVPVTGRRRWIVTSLKREHDSGDQQYHKLLQQFQSNILPSTHRASATVNRVGERLASALIEFAELYKFAMSDDMSKNINKPYTFTVVRSEMANALVLPGNHVFVFTGLFRYVQSEDELAVILGHEMAHNLARHVGEKLSFFYITSSVVLVPLLLLAHARKLVKPTLQLLILLVIIIECFHCFIQLPYVRALEIEADHIGILLAADACYDPRAAKRMQVAVMDSLSTCNCERSRLSKFLSPHPSQDKRVVKINEWTLKAMERFKEQDRCIKVREHMYEARQIAALEAKRRGE